MKTLHIVVEVGSTLDEGTFAKFPGIEVYHVDGPDAEERIDMALLNDLVMPIKWRSSVAAKPDASPNSMVPIGSKTAMPWRRSG